MAELNAREKMIWTKIMLSDHGYQNDESLWNEIDLNLGEQYRGMTHRKKMAAL